MFFKIIISAMLSFICFNMFSMTETFGEERSVELFQEIEAPSKKSNMDYDLTEYLKIEEPLTMKVEPIKLDVSEFDLSEELSNVLNKERKEVLIDSIINEGMAQLGKPYVFGASGGDSFDCSMLVKHSMESEGLTCPRTSREQRKMSRYIKFEELERGDLIFWHKGSINDYSNVRHVAIYLGNGKMLQATPPKVVVSNVVKNFNKGYNISYGRYDYLSKV